MEGQRISRPETQRRRNPRFKSPHPRTGIATVEDAAGTTEGNSWSQHLFVLSTSVLYHWHSELFLLFSVVKNRTKKPRKPFSLSFSLSPFLPFSLSHFLAFSLSRFLTFSLSHFLTFSLSHFLPFSLSPLPAWLTQWVCSKRKNNVFCVSLFSISILLAFSLNNMICNE